MGQKKTIKLEEGCENGKGYIVKGKGMPIITNIYGGIGDFLIRIKFKFPKKLSREQKALLKEFKW